MNIKDLIPWHRQGVTGRFRTEGDHPLTVLQRDMNRVFEEFWNGFPSASGVASPQTDVVETDNAVEISMELPGMDEKDIELSVNDDSLVIRGEKKHEREEEKKGYYLAERSYGSFFRSIPLPRGVDTENVKAETKKGVLTVTLPKTEEAKSHSRKIDIRAA